VRSSNWKLEKLYNKELHNLCCSPNIIRVIKLRRMSWVEYVACLGEVRNAYKILVENLKGKKPHG
jgi:hypothetical protein